MLVLLFELGGARYALDATQVVEVLPLVNLREQAHAAPCVAGVFDFRGTPVPVIDLSQVTMGRHAIRRLSTRVIVVKGAIGRNAQSVGLLAERATETARRAESDFIAAPVSGDQAPCLGPVATGESGLLQLVDVNRLVARFLTAPEAGYALR